MPQPPNDPVLNGFVGGVILASIATCVYVIGLLRRGPVLRFEPRRPVPWGAPAAVLAAVFVAMAVVPSFVGGEGGDAAAKRDANELATALVGMLLSELAMVGPFLFAVAVMTRATPRDLGLPADGRGFARDVLMGIVACLASLAPVVLLQALLMQFLQMKESGHELVKIVIEGEPNFVVLVLASIAAVVIAPLCEEVTFRLLLQGWLEKWEDEKLGWRGVTETAAENDEARMTNDEVLTPDDSSFVIRHSSLEAERAVAEEVATAPPARGVAGLPYGWLPILISSLMFAAAHFGYGPDPVPLFFLALVLGYVYQRTHRIVPGIVIHALFNGFTMVILWRMALSGVK